MTAFHSPLLLGAHTFDPQRGELIQADGAPAPLRRQALHLLRVLAERPGEVVAKDTLMDRVWPDVVVTEGSLTQAIAEIRRVLGDDGHRLVCNVARRGYRLVPDEPPERLPLLSMVVLPFAVEGDGEALSWMAQALHGDLIDELGRWTGSLVIARETSAQFSRDADPRNVARELSVRNVISGRLRFEGSQVRLQVQRICGETGGQTGSETVLVERAELPRGIADLAMQVVRALQPGLVDDAVHDVARLSPARLDAEAFTMQAMALTYRSLTHGRVREAMALLERAVALDQDSVRSWRLLANLAIKCLINGWGDDMAACQARIEQAGAHLRRLQPDGPDEVTVRVIQAFLRGEVRTMLRLARTLCQLHRHPVNFGTLGLASVLNGLADEATEALQLALRLSPRDAMRAEWLNRLAVARYMIDDDQEAVDYAESALDANPALAWPPVHAAALWRRGEQAAAARAWREHRARHPAVGPEQLEVRLPGDHPVLAATRQSLVEALRGAAQAAGH